MTDDHHVARMNRLEQDNRDLAAKVDDLREKIADTKSTERIHARVDRLREDLLDKVAQLSAKVDRIVIAVLVRVVLALGGIAGTVAGAWLIVKLVNT